MNTTEEYWEVDGQSLHTYAFAIQTLTGRDGLPPRRGDNQRVAYRAGEIWRPKSFGARPLSLAMWVIGRTEDNGAGPSGYQAQWRTNLELLKGLFAPTDRLLTLTKRVRSNAGLATLTAEAEVVGAIEPNVERPGRAAFVVDMLMPDPFWYGPEVTVTLPIGSTTVVNPGSATSERMLLRMNGPLTNVQLVNTSLTPSVTMSYTGTIDSGDWVELDVGLFRAVDQDDASHLGQVTHSGARPWMVLQPGGNGLVLNASAGTGDVDLTFSPPYL